MGVLRKIILILTMASPTYAMVNLKTASFVYKVDVLKDVQPLSLIYRSRTQHKGLFGFGWCSLLENKIVFMPNGKMQVVDCSKDYDPVFEKLEREANNYIYVSGSIKYYFSMKGVLQKFIISDVLWRVKQTDPYQIKLFYGTQSLTLDLNINKHVSRIQSDSKQRVQFNYQGANLAFIKSKSKLESFDYDQFHNLVKLKGNKILDISYDVDRDRVTNVKDSQGCRKSIQYNLRNVSAIKSCKNGPLKKLELSL